MTSAWMIMLAVYRTPLIPRMHHDQDPPGDVLRTLMDSGPVAAPAFNGWLHEPSTRQGLTRATSRAGRSRLLQACRISGF